VRRGPARGGWPTPAMPAQRQVLQRSRPRWLVQEALGGRGRRKTNGATRWADKRATEGRCGGEGRAESVGGANQDCGCRSAPQPQVYMWRVPSQVGAPAARASRAAVVTAAMPAQANAADTAPARAPTSAFASRCATTTTFDSPLLARSLCVDACTANGRRRACPCGRPSCGCRDAL